MKNFPYSPHWQVMSLLLVALFELRKPRSKNEVIRFISDKKWFCLQASNTVTATALDRFRLRWPARMGSYRHCAGPKQARTASEIPLVSEPNPSQSPGLNATP